MRSEVKVGMIVAFVAIVGGAIWWFRGTDNELGALPLDRRAMDETPAGDAVLSGDFVVTPPDTATETDVSPAVADRTTAAPTRREGTVLPPAGWADQEPVATVSTPTEPPPEDDSAVGTRGEREPSAAQPTMADERLSIAPTRPDADDGAVTPTESLDTPPPDVEAPLRRDSALDRTRLPKRETYTIVPGDRLIDLAKEHYGDGNLYKAIQAANPDIDPNRLKVGAKIEIPSREEALLLTRPATRGTTAASTEVAGGPARPQVDRATYIVGRGDTLTAIARNVLKDESRWDEIFALNRDKLDSPDLLLVGMDLKLPPLERKAPTTQDDE